jgi:DNA polymerase-3 subunit epsilon
VIREGCPAIRYTGGMATFVALDFETAAYGGITACALGMVRVEDGQVTAERVLLIRPPARRFAFSWLHGITWDDVRDQPDFAGHWPAIAAMLDGADYLAAHNAPFDRGVMAACCVHYGLAPPLQDFLCTVRLAREAWNIRPTRLPDVCRWLAIPLPRHHDALHDARACAEIVRCAAMDADTRKLLPRRTRAVPA